MNVFKALRVRLLLRLTENGKFCQNPLKSVHVLCTDGVSSVSGWFKVAPALDTDTVENFFQHKVPKMLQRKGKITEEVVELIQPIPLLHTDRKHESESLHSEFQEIGLEVL